MMFPIAGEAEGGVYASGGFDFSAGEGAKMEMFAKTRQWFFHAGLDAARLTRDHVRGGDGRGWLCAP